MVSTDVWAGSRSTKPPIIELLSTDNRAISVNLSAAVVSGETIQGASLVASVSNYRTGLPIAPSPIVPPPAYNATSKIAAATINGSLLPRNEPCALTFSFAVTGPSPTETRSVFVVLWVPL
jgi:hypothetical protein